MGNNGPCSVQVEKLKPSIEPKNMNSLIVRKCCEWSQKTKRSLILILFLVYYGEVSATTMIDSADPFVDLNIGWKFHLGDIEGAQTLDFDDSNWQTLDLPHDWSIYQKRDPDMADGAYLSYLPGGIGWYRKDLIIPSNRSGDSVDLIFDGVQQECEVWINGHYLGLQTHGYVGFVHSLTLYLNPPGEINVVAVRAINPEQNSRWYTGSGIYRDVKLRFRNQIDVQTFGLYFDTLSIFKNGAKLQIRTDLCNETNVSEMVAVSLRLESPSGSINTYDLGVIQLAPKSTEQISQMFTVESAELWSPNSPRMYIAYLDLSVRGRSVGGMRQMFGIRKIELSPDKGFLLNNEKVVLKGACLHHDNGLIGAAAFKESEWRRVALMKENGFNAIRTAHNPPSTSFLEACDKLGMFVIDEFADSWYLPKKKNGYSRYFHKHWESDLKAMLKRDYNHPSVVIWSIGNEIPERSLALGVEISRKMVQQIKSVDAFRPVTNAFCIAFDLPSVGFDWAVMDPGLATLDIAGYNYLHSRFEQDHEQHPDRVFVSTESYPKDVLKVWSLVNQMSYVIGDFVWTGMDHLGESGIGRTRYQERGKSDSGLLGKWPYVVNWSGDIDLIGNKKPQSYFRDVVWDLSPVEILVHSPGNGEKRERVTNWGWPDEVPSWCWPENEGVEMNVRVFTKAPLVQLKLNGRIVADQNTGLNDGIIWDFKVPYEPGDMTAQVFDSEGQLIGSKSLVTPGEAFGIRVVLGLEDTPANAQRSVVYLPLELVDEAGRLVDNAQIPLSVTVEGAANLLAFGNANPTDPQPYWDRETTTFRGRALLILRSDGFSGDVQIRVSSPQLPDLDYRVSVQ